MTRELVKRIGTRLTARAWRLAVAESATGGLLGHLITEVPGCSAFFWGGVIAYANEVKTGLLGVQEASLERWGAVSVQVALEMAEGVRQATHAQVALSITGIAGPTGATETKPLGLYYIALAAPGERRCWRHHFPGNRHENNQRAAKAALEHLARYLGIEAGLPSLGS